jgi:hypothetical protein
MNKAHLISLFGIGCAANSLLSWLADIHPNAASVAKGIYVIAVILILSGLFLDDLVYPILKISQLAYYGLLAASLLTILVGSGLIWLVQ